MAEQDAQDINQMMSASAPGVTSPPKKSKLLWIVLGCVVIGVGLGIVVYQQSIKPTPTVRTTPKPVTTPPPATAPTVNAVFPEPNTVAFPKAGQLRVYYKIGDGQGLKIEMTVAGQTTTATIPAGAVTTAMRVFDTGLTLNGPSSVQIKTTVLPGTQASNGWISPSADNKCGANGFVLVDITDELAYATSQAGGEPLVSKQCWTDYEPPKANGNPAAPDFNDYRLFWSYTPSTTTPSPSPSSVASATPTPSASASLVPTSSPSPAASKTPTPSPSPSKTPTPSPSPSKTPTPSPSPSKTPTPSPSVAASPTATPTPSASPRVTMPDTSGGTPVTGIFEVTVGTISIGLLLLILGLFGLLAL